MHNTDCFKYLVNVCAHFFLLIVHFRSFSVFLTLLISSVGQKEFMRLILPINSFSFFLHIFRVLFFFQLIIFFLCFSVYQIINFSCSLATRPTKSFERNPLLVTVSSLSFSLSTSVFAHFRLTTFSVCSNANRFGSGRENEIQKEREKKMENSYGLSRLFEKFWKFFDLHSV